MTTPHPVSADHSPAGPAEESEPILPRKRVISWALWDWATQPFNSVILTFVWVPLYLISDNLLSPDVVNSPDRDAALATLSSNFGVALGVAGVLILLLAPALGQQADARGRKKRWLLLATAVLALCQFALFFVHADPAYFWYGAVMMAAGSVVSEIAGVNYNAMLVQVSTPKTVGKVSGLGWGMGYLGGIVALVIVVLLNQFEWFGMDTSNGMAYRLIAVGAAVWTVVFTVPMVINVPETMAYGDNEKHNFFYSYVVLIKDLISLFKTHRPTFWFLFASAVYRDGLAGVFAFGGVLAAAGFGFSAQEVIIFGIALNVVAGLSTILVGRLDDRFGPRAVIVTSLCVLVGSCLLVFILSGEGKLVLWIGGVILSAAVGPAQAASRSLLARLTPEGMQGEIFGLYATTGRLVSTLSPFAWSISVAAIGAVYGGIIGITAVLALGLVLLLLVRMPKYVRI